MNAMHAPRRKANGPSKSQKAASEAAVPAFDAQAFLMPVGDFFSEGCLAGQRLHMATAVAMATSTFARIENDTMIGVLHDEPKLSEMFMTFLISRNVKCEADLVDQLFNSSEKRTSLMNIIVHA